MEMTQKREANKAIICGIWVFTVVVYALVIILHELPQADFTPSFAKYQPLLHAIINGTVAICLVCSLIAIKSKNVALHQKLNTTALLLSVLFLLSYIVYHYLAGDTKYGGDYMGFYVFILLSHILLAGLSLPGILLAYYQGWLGNITKHRKIVKFIYPIWLYVSVTGVAVYLFLAPYYEI